LRSKLASDFWRRDVGRHQLNRISVPYSAACDHAAESSPLPVLLLLQTRANLVHARARLTGPGHFQYRFTDLEALAREEIIYAQPPRGDVLLDLAGLQAEALQGFAVHQEYLSATAGPAMTAAFQSSVG
jgi:hypothetical protein